MAVTRLLHGCCNAVATLLHDCCNAVVTLLRDCYLRAGAPGGEEGLWEIVGSHADGQRRLLVVLVGEELGEEALLPN